MKHILPINTYNPIRVYCVAVIVVFSLLFVLMLALETHAQAATGSISITLSPKTPGLYEMVVVTLESETIDLGLSNITWTLNGTVRLVGVGESRARFTTRGLGSSSRVSVVIETDKGELFVREVEVIPSEINLVWEAFSYTPPFYRGKALAPSAGLITFVAMPEIADSAGKKIDPKKLVYTWSQSGVVLGKASGVGRQSIVLQNEILREVPLIVSVSVSSPNGSVRAQSTAVVPVYAQEILIYEKRPLEGVVYGSVIKGLYNFTEDEVVFRAEPYFFSLEDVFGRLLNYRWRVDRKDIDIPREEQGNEITFRREGVETGQAEVLLKVINNNLPFKVLQEAETSFNVLFK